MLADAKDLIEPLPEMPVDVAGAVRQKQDAYPHSDTSISRKRLADRSRRLVAVLNDRFRVVDDGIQWMLQKRKGRPTSKSTGWRGCGSCVRSRALLLDGISKLQVDPDTPPSRCCLTITPP
jgi:hypothetical protein